MMWHFISVILSSNCIDSLSADPHQDTILIAMGVKRKAFKKGRRSDIFCSSDGLHYVFVGTYRKMLGNIKCLQEQLCYKFAPLEYLCHLTVGTCAVCVAIWLDIAFLAMKTAVDHLELIHTYNFHTFYQTVFTLCVKAISSTTSLMSSMMLNNAPPWGNKCCFPLYDRTFKRLSW